MIKYGFQTYTWQMSFEKYADKIEHIVDITKQGGMHAIEPDTSLLTKFFDTPETFKKALDDKGIELASLCIVCDWLNNGETAKEKEFADKSINFVKAFPNPMLLLVQMPQNDRNDLAERQKNALTCLHDVAKRAADLGVKSVFHPNSPPGSIFRTFDDYKLMFDGLDSKYVGFAADSGHIINGGMDVYDIFRDYMSFIKHVHYKDITSDNKWCIMGEGITDFIKLTQMLYDSKYNGYILVEDESADAEDDPDAVTLKNAEYIRNKLFPVTK